MNFLFNMLNHNESGQRSLEDVIGIFGHQLRALGHEAIWEKSNDKFLHASRGINVIVEGFTAPTIRVFSEAHAAGARFVILATEEPSDRGFNQGTQDEMIERQRVFPLAAQFAEAILHLVPGEHVTRWYSQFAPTAQIELGYAPTIVRPADPQYDPPFDFGFYGSLTKRRLKILKKLADLCNKKNAIRVVGDFQEQRDRDKIMREAKIVLQIRKFEEMGLVSSSRCNTALCLGRPVVAEPHLLSRPWDEVVTFAQNERSFYDVALMMRAGWRGAHERQFNRFRDKFSPEFCVGRALDKIGILDPDRMRAAA